MAHRLFATLLVTAVLLSPAAAQSKAGLRAGAATSNITPPLGQPIVGGFAPFPSTNIHDELRARCLVLDDGKTKLAIVVCDLLSFDRLVSDEARALIERDLGIPHDNVLISATHTHSASSALGSDPRVVHQTMDDYQRFVARRIVDGVKRAHHVLRPAEIAWGSVDAPDHVFNRRWYLKPGKMPPNPFGGIDKVKMNPGAGNADLVEPAGPTDPAVAIVALREPGGRPIAVWTTYSLHYIGDVGPGDISADYYGMYCDMLAGRLGGATKSPPVVVLMANGTSGDINNINFRTPRPRKKPYEHMREVADDIAGKVEAAVAKLSFRNDVTLGARYREPMIGMRRPTPEELDWAKKTVAERKPGPKADLPLIYAQRALRMADYPAELKMPLQALRIGDVAVGTMPVEILCEIGLEFKKRHAGRPAWLVCLAHGSYGYLPPPRQHDLGGYETWLGTNRLERHASEKMLATLNEMVAELGR